jgi:hypothetical protein
MLSPQEVKHLESLADAASRLLHQRMPLPKIMDIVAGAHIIAWRASPEELTAVEYRRIVDWLGGYLDVIVSAESSEKLAHHAMSYTEKTAGAVARCEYAEALLFSALASIALGCIARLAQEKAEAPLAPESVEEVRSSVH